MSVKQERASEREGERREREKMVARGGEGGDRPITPEFL